MGLRHSPPTPTSFIASPKRAITCCASKPSPAKAGPDYSYELKIAPGALPQDQAPRRGGGWDERDWTRRLDAARLSQLEKRGGKDRPQPSIETYRAGPEPVIFKIPGTLEGALAQPGETHRARFHLDKPADIAIEIETPAAAPPYFNPIFRLLNNAGEEVASNIFAGKGACTGAMTKSMQSKTILPLRDTGDYTLEIRDATADLAGADFQYRVQVRPQVPHVGQVKVDADAMNLAQGEAKMIRVAFDREEDYRGAVTVAAESLPARCLRRSRRRFRTGQGSAARHWQARTLHAAYRPRSGGAHRRRRRCQSPREPQDVRLVVRPLVDGKPGEVLWSKTIPMMVLAKP